MSGGARLRFGGLLLAFGICSLSWTFGVYHLANASDAARLEPGAPSITANGLVVAPVGDQPNGLRTGDEVIAVDGRSMEDWARLLFDPGASRPPWQVGQTLTYTVMRDGVKVDVPLTLRSYALSAVVAKTWSTLGFVFFSQLVLTFAFLVKPRERAAQALFLWVWSLSHTYAWSLSLEVGDFVTGIGYWLYRLPVVLAWLTFWSSNLYFNLVFPEPLALLRRRRWLTPLIFLGSFLFFGSILLAARLQSSGELDWLRNWTPAEWLVAVASLILSLVVTVYRYRTPQSQAAQQKLHWFVFAFMVSGGAGLALWFGPGLLLGRPLVDASTFGLVLLPFPLFLTIALLRHQLFDIDIIVHRTLSYSLLTLTLLVLYYASVLLLQAVFRTLTGQTQSEIVTVMSTLLIAAVFVPLRSQVQNAIDIRFYRRKYDAQRVLAEFSAGVRDEVELNRLQEHLLATVGETLEPAHVSLWLKSANGQTAETGMRREP